MPNKYFLKISKNTWMSKRMNKLIQLSIVDYHILDTASTIEQGSPNFLAPETDFVEVNFSTDGVVEGWGWFWSGSSMLHLLWTLFLLSLHKLHLRTPGLRSWRLRTSAIEDLVSISTEICLVFMAFCLFDKYICSVLQINYQFCCSNNHTQAWLKPPLYTNKAP